MILVPSRSFSKTYSPVRGHFRRTSPPTGARTFSQSGLRHSSALRLQELRELSSIEEIHAHQAPVMGLVAQQLEIPLNIAVRKFVFCNMRDLLSAAVRLNVIGPVQAQIVQDHIRDVCEKIISDCSDLELHQKTQTAPFLELLQATHERIYSKLFQS
jgi:urease accessory protein